MGSKWKVAKFKESGLIQNCNCGLKTYFRLISVLFSEWGGCVGKNKFNFPCRLVSQHEGNDVGRDRTASLGLLQSREGFALTLTVLEEHAEAVST